MADTQEIVSRRQFFSCLKLIAAAQASIPLNTDVLTADTVLPLPRFILLSGDSLGGGPPGLSNGSSYSDPFQDASPFATASSSIENCAGTGSGLNASRSPSDLIELSNRLLPRAPEPRNDEDGNPLDGNAVAGSSDQPSTDSEIEQNDDDSSAIENSV